MKNTTRRAYVIYALVIAFLIGLGFLLYSFAANGNTWAASRLNTHIFTNRVLTRAGAVKDRNGTVLVETKDGKRVWNESSGVRRATLHAVGDAQGYIATGVQTLYRAKLIGYDFFTGLYKSANKQTDITLTLDAEVCKTALEAMNGKKGTVAAYNYKTGELLCMVSAPTYDPLYKPSDINTDTTGKYDGVYLNRAISGVFTPGSTFKVVTAICALENIPDVQTRKFTCKGKIALGKGEVICNGIHGTVSFERGLNVSCNCVFAELAAELGRDKLTETVRSLGFGKSVSVSGAKTVRSSFDVSKAGKLDLGWAGIGQYTTLVNPLQMLMLAGAIANGGDAMTPRLVQNDGTLGKLIDLAGGVNKNIKLSPETAKTVAALLRSNVKNYYGDSRFPNLQFCGKTGSAEVEGKKSHAWFFGFSQREDFPVAIVVCLENGGIGLNDAIPVANKVLQKLLQLGI